MADVNNFEQWFKNNCINRVSAFNVESESEFPTSRFKPVNGWCAASTMKLINFVVTECLEEGEEYLEIGSYCGRSIIAALLNNDQLAQVIEPFDLFLPDGALIQFMWDVNVSQIGVRDRITLHKTDYMGFNERLPPVGVLYYDGNHDAGHTYHALKKFEKYLSDRAIVIVDDYNVYGGSQTTRLHGYNPVDWPVEEDVETWVKETGETELLWVTPWENGQAIIIYDRNKNG